MSRWAHCFLSIICRLYRTLNEVSSEVRLSRHSGDRRDQQWYEFPSIVTK